jgi:hypothetical protein
VPTATIISVLNLLSGVVALLISYYAYKNNRLVGSILLRYISVGFLILGIGLFLQAGTETIIGLTAVQAAKVRGDELLAYLVYNALQLLAYGVFAWGYGLSAFSRGKSPAAVVPAVFATAASALTRRLLDVIVFILVVYVASQVGIVILLFVIVFQAVRVFSHSQSNLALMVLFGFALIFFGHLLMLGAIVALDSTIFLVGNTIEFCGFLALLFFLIWSGRVVK